ncbi:hypothetical protein [Bifidobacterium tibiigranuli]|jgi:hypothetical protein|uniref:hypothetical protein n=1 Tax=Bifidobacterium tibiigranuli TaxID=2172043 RepID=UPI0023550F64|nr:hypothetical protein [Bifidobacterium tibiigranuli]MCI1210687.1 hypothetical protein [Bifidobacterium tibiigranuli]MCI1220755.1 hypothetical protein [Bifidobacterium tibiigranuli]
MAEDIHKLLRDAFDEAGPRPDTRWPLERFALDLWAQGALEHEQLSRIVRLMRDDD